MSKLAKKCPIKFDKVEQKVLDKVERL